MKIRNIILSLIISFTLTQDRSYLFYTTPSSSGESYDITANSGISQKFPSTAYPLYEDYMLERISFYYTMVSPSANIRVQIRENIINGEAQSPGDIMEGAEWNITLLGGGLIDTIQEYIFYTTSDCIKLDKDKYYWISLIAADENSHIQWPHTLGSIYSISTTDSNGNLWSISETGHAGASKISAEAIYYAPEIDFNDELSGDVNLDGLLNVLDIVTLVDYILGGSSLSEQQLISSDFNNDNLINILDVVGLVNQILGGNAPDWSLEDINPNSESYNQNVGPEVYLSNNQITGYYFGKAG